MFFLYPRLSWVLSNDLSNNPDTPSHHREGGGWRSSSRWWHGLGQNLQHLQPPPSVHGKYSHFYTKWNLSKLNNLLSSFFFFKWDNYNLKKFNFVIQAHWQVLPALKYLPLIRKKYFYIKIYVCNLLLPFESRFKVHVEFYFCYHCMRPSYASLTFSLDISMNVRFPVSECIN